MVVKSRRKPKLMSPEVERGSLYVDIQKVFEKKKMTYKAPQGSPRTKVRQEFKIGMPTKVAEDDRLDFTIHSIDHSEESSVEPSR